MASKRINKELRDLQRDPPVSCSAGSSVDIIIADRSKPVPEIAHTYKTYHVKYESIARSWTQKYAMG